MFVEIVIFIENIQCSAFYSPLAVMSEFSEYAFKITEKGASVSSGTLSSMIEMESPSEEQLAKDRITDNVQIENKQFVKILPFFMTLIFLYAN